MSDYRRTFPETSQGTGMADADLQQRLSGISTRWSLIFDAHKGQGASVTAAQSVLMQRYSAAVYRYLRAVVRDPNEAEELAQEFALRFVRGDFKNADPQRGRFRDYVKTVLYHLIADHFKRRQSQPRPLPADESQLPTVAPDVGEQEREFMLRWREALLERTWEALAEAQERADTLYLTVLRWRAENPRAPAADLATDLTRRLGKRFTEAGIRQTLHRARDKFADLLLEEVARSLETSARDRLRQELIDLDLLGYCGPALDRWVAKP
jgi:RNA polymerase sigma-70 factor (ECF subfamily)